MADGSFLVKANNDICYQLKQKYNLQLIKDICLLLNINQRISINQNKYIQLTISSKNEIQKIIDFFSNNNNHPLLGKKLLSYQI
jgi:hypothetical protein